MLKLELGVGYNSRIDKGGTPHIRIGLDTAHYSEWGGTPHITPHNSQNQGGDTAQENVFRCSHWGGDTAQNSK